MSSINISHLIGKKVKVVHYTQFKVSSYVTGILEKHDGDYFVYTNTPLVSFLKTLFRLGSPSYIKFHWSSVSLFTENTICLIHLTKDELIEVASKVGMELKESDFHK
jgi:hypothetical protein